ncbi:MAG: hypothetical protein D6770_07530 [Anaerolineae bacterium]|nr:MAG: hypothetical protein D6770_07530 [Anaerolineae bacterium]
MGLLVFLALGTLGGYSSGMEVRKSAEATLIARQLGEQYQLAMEDMDAGRYEAARQRLDYILRYDPTYPGAMEKYAEVLVLANVPTATLTPTLTPTPDYSGVEAIYSRAVELMAAQDWPGTLAALDELRKEDPTYRAAEVDSMYYMALRNNGWEKIVQGDLEGGIYYLTLAERFGPLDGAADGLRSGARLYITAASFWGVNWEQAVNYFSQVAAGWPSMWDGTMSAAERYRIASMRYGDELFANHKYCAAYAQYANALNYGALDEQAAKNAKEAYEICYPPTPTPTPTEVIIPPGGGGGDGGGGDGGGGNGGGGGGG